MIKRCHPSTLLLVIPVLSVVSSQCPDTGIQVTHKQTSIESGTTFSMRLQKVWIPASSAGMTSL
ncbi:hypothetical protein [Wolbachia endosymbiont (group B) of Athalia cordata]|uniref:hypothetical protein n=1 Tax=Wolbachia endosymbiont (group B) of Athalia cordata TaxID=2953986 RepID=UPI002231F51E|nr:hypothetical protein [Wolbachia endosymbiont (group B) of Athalia cordata]